MTSSILQISVAWVSISTDSLHSSLLYIYNIWNLLSMWIIPHSIYSVLTIYWLLSSPCLTGTAVCFFLTFSISSWCVCVELFCTVSNLLDCFFYPCTMLFPPIHHFTHNPSLQPLFHLGHLAHIFSTLLDSLFSFVSENVILFLLCFVVVSMSVSLLISFALYMSSF